MPFENPLVAGEELIRSGIRSQDYVEGVKGWRVAREGGSEFEDLVARENVSGRRGEFSESLSYQGTELGELLDSLPRGIVAYGARVHNGQTWGTGTRGPVALMSFVAKAKRFYMIHLSGMEVSAGTNGRTISQIFRLTENGTTPNANSPVLYGSQVQIPYSKTGWSGFPNGMDGAYANQSDVDINVKIGVFLTMGEGDGTSDLGTWAGNGAVFWAEDVGKWTGSEAFNVAWMDPGVVAPPQTDYDETYWWSAVQSYRSDGQKSIATGNNTRAYQGDGSIVGNPGGNHCGAFFFDTGHIRNRLAGASILETFVYLDNMHTYNNAGGTARIGTHNSDPAPGTVPDRWENRWQAGHTKGGDVWTGNLGPALGNELRDGTSRGITVGYGGDYSYYDRCAIRIRFRK